MFLFFEGWLATLAKLAALAAVPRFDFDFLIGPSSVQVCVFLEISYGISYGEKNDLIQFLNTGQSKYPIGYFLREHTGNTRLCAPFFALSHGLTFSLYGFRFESLSQVFLFICYCFRLLICYPYPALATRSTLDPFSFLGWLAALAKLATLAAVPSQCS